MPTETEGPIGAIAGAIALSVAIFFAWALLLAGLSDIHGGGDAADAGLGPLIVTTLTVLIWGGLGGLTLIARFKGDMPRSATLAALAGLPISFGAALVSLNLLQRPGVTPFLWPIVVPAGVPPLIVVFCFWALVPAIRHAIPAFVAQGLLWGGTLLLCAGTVPMEQLRQADTARREAAAEQWRTAFAAVPGDAPLWEWTRFLAATDDQTSGRALERIRGLDRRQQDAETMLARGDFPPGRLDSFDLDPNAPLCDKARPWLRSRAAALVLRTPGSKPYSDVAETMGGALTDMKWLVGYGCSCDAESLAWESMANAYRDPDDLVAQMAELRDPGLLGKIRREYPAHFWMLNQDATLSAWLFYADDMTVSDKALAGARTLAHRTEEMVTLLTNKNDDDARRYLYYVPRLDLEPTPALCFAATKVLRQYLSGVARPDVADPRPYEDLLARLSYTPNFSVLVWLASRDCDVNAELAEADNLIGAYQPSPEGEAMRATLLKLRWPS